MGLVYDVLEFLNSDVLPNHRERRSRTQNVILNYAIQKGRGYLSATGFGDLVLWMLDHGIEIPDLPPDPDLYDRSTSHSFCTSSGYFGYQVYDYQDQFSNKFHSEQEMKLTVSGTTGQVFKKETLTYTPNPLRGGTPLTTTYNYGLRWTMLDDSISAYVTLINEGHRMIPLAPFSATNQYIAVTSQSWDWGLMPSIVMEGRSYGYDFEPQLLCNKTVPKYVVRFIQQGSRTPPRLGLYSYTHPTVNFDESLAPMLGYLTYYTLGGSSYFPAFSDINSMTSATASNMLRKLSLNRLVIPVAYPNLDPISRSLFGDIVPDWYSSL
jgi:hypothetical protein